MFSSKLVFPCLVRNLYNNEDDEEEEEDEDDSDSLSQADSHVWIVNKQFVQKKKFCFGRNYFRNENCYISNENLGK